MRSGRQLESTPREWANVQRAEAARARAALLEELRRSRDEPWYRWIVDDWRPRRLAGGAT